MTDEDNNPSSNRGPAGLSAEDKKRRKKARLALKKKIATLDDEIKKSLSKTRYMRTKQQRAKENRQILLGFIGVIAIGIIAYLIFAPRKGGMDYALCRTFIEMRVEYPPELDFTYVRRFPNNKLRVWYVRHDSFGQRQIEKLDCFFNYDQNGQIFLQKAEMNRGQIDPRDIQKFNRSVPAILANPPDLTLPRGLPNDMKRFYKANE